jgi:hypothetical protein
MGLYKPDFAYTFAGESHFLYCILTKCILQKNNNQAGNFFPSLDLIGRNVPVSTGTLF